MIVSNIMNEIPIELIYDIYKYIHYQYQMVVNKSISNTVEKIEDAQRMDDLIYYHLHHIDNCSLPPCFMPNLFKRATYKWIYETINDCMEFDNNGNIIGECDKNTMYRKWECIKK